MSVYFREAFPSNKVIKFRTDFRNTIYDLFLYRKWELTTHDTDWNLCWSERDWINENYDNMSFRNDQYVNHFRNYYELTRKDLLAKNIKRLKKQSEKKKSQEEMEELDIAPMTYALPLEYKLFIEEFKKNKNTLWIMKPIGKSQGKGIFLINRLSQIKEWNISKSKMIEEKEKEREREREREKEKERIKEMELERDKKKGKEKDKEKDKDKDKDKDKEKEKEKEKEEMQKEIEAEKETQKDSSDMPEQYIVQQYIENPLLIGGKKFDIRLYVLISSYYPLTIYLYRNGFARFSHTYFKNEKNKLKDISMHLTNVSIQKNVEGYDDITGGKWFIRELFLYLNSRFGYNRVAKLIKEIESCIIQSFLAVHNIIINDKHCFELYGYDILIDNNLKPWLIEVNSFPSFSSNTQEDYKVKFNLLDELMTIINIEKYNIPVLDRIGDFDCIYRNGKRTNNFENFNFFSQLGAFPSGSENLKQIAKNIKRKSFNKTSSSFSK